MIKILEFTLPVAETKSIIIKEERLPHFYPYLHRHNEVQLTWIIRGSGTLITGNSMHNFQQNEIFWIGANQPHVFKSDPNCFKEKSVVRTHSMDIFFNVDSRLASFFEMPEIKQLKTFIDQHRNGFRIPQNKVEVVAAKMRQVSKYSGVEQFISFMDLLKFISSIKRLPSLAAESVAVQVSDTEGLRIASVYNYVMQNYREEITLEQVSRLACMTPQAFCRYFKKHTHNTLMSFINQVRINEACKQLMEGDKATVARIAYNTGFNSITNFNRVFKGIIKKSPKEYLQSYMQQID